MDDRAGDHADERNFRFSDPMKIAVISNVCGCSWAGSEEVWYRMALAAQAAGDEVLACLHRDLHAGSPLELLRRQGGQVLAWQRGRVARLENLVQRFRPNFSDRRLEFPDVILLSCGSLPAITHVPGLMRYLRQTKTRFAVLCLFNADALAISPSERRDVAWLLENAKCQAFVADHNRTLAVRQFGVTLDDAAVFYGPLRQRFDQPVPMPNEDSEVVFSCVARLDTLWKAQDILLEVLAASAWRDRKWKLRLYGTGVDTDHLHRLVRMYGLLDRVTFKGYACDIREIWEDSQIMMLPSRGEGTPLATLEAMMCGRPVVTTDVGGHREVIIDGESGWIAEAATPYCFAMAMERAWEDRSKWAAMGMTAHRKALEIADLQPSLRLLAKLKSSYYNSLSVPPDIDC